MSILKRRQRQLFIFKFRLKFLRSLYFTFLIPACRSYVTADV
ncbi:hypothetical protein HMPREF3033_00668 [Veillonellaceae bacterium DNF00751]|nr:hypothetical protein HMPREF3033_00668 [Veillonellaceae bacterium DNF00751]